LIARSDWTEKDSMQAGEPCGLIKGFTQLRLRRYKYV